MEKYALYYDFVDGEDHRGVQTSFTGSDNVPLPQVLEELKAFLVAAGFEYITALTAHGNERDWSSEEQ